VKLTAAEGARIDEIAPRGVAAGARYHTEGMKRVGL